MTERTVMMLRASVLASAAILAALLPGQLRTAEEMRRGREGYMEIRKQAQTVTEEVPDALAEGMTCTLDDTMRNINSDYIGWIEIPGTGISYPVVQTDDNEEYLKKDFDGRNYAGGAIFMDCRCRPDMQGRNTLIYGHCMRDGSMFTDLVRFLEKEFLRNTGTVIITMNGRRYVYRVFSAYVAAPESDCFRAEFTSDYDYERWLLDQKDRSVTESGVYPDRSDRIITLVTCYGDGSKRCVVQAALVRTEEAD